MEALFLNYSNTYLVFLYCSLLVAWHFCQYRYTCNKLKTCTETLKITKLHFCVVVLLNEGLYRKKVSSSNCQSVSSNYFKKFPAPLIMMVTVTCQVQAGIGIQFSPDYCSSTCSAVMSQQAQIRLPVSQCTWIILSGLCILCKPDLSLTKVMDVLSLLTVMLNVCPISDVPISDNKVSKFSQC